MGRQVCSQHSERSRNHNCKFSNDGFKSLMEDIVGRCAVFHLCCRTPNSESHMTREQTNSYIFLYALDRLTPLIIASAGWSSLESY